MIQLYSFVMYAEICEIIVQWSKEYHIILPTIEYDNFSIISVVFKYIGTYLN